MGSWRQNTAQWYEQTMLYCELCGKIIPKKFWLVKEGSREQIFCDPSCERLYQDYWVPSRQTKA